MIIQTREGKEVFIWYHTDRRTFVRVNRGGNGETSNNRAEFYASHENNNYIGPLELTRWES
jgi:hypothetical protein